MKDTADQLNVIMVNTVDKFEIDLHNANCVVFTPT